MSRAGNADDHSRCCASPRLAPRRRVARCLLVVFLPAFLLCAVGAGARSAEEARLLPGARYFRATLNAIQDLDRRLETGGDDDRQPHVLVVVYGAHLDGPGTDRLERQLLARLTGDGAIKGFPVRVETTADPELGGHVGRPVAGVFVADMPDDAALERLIRTGRERGILIFSPFEGHVERGVQAGLAVEAEVRPLINPRALAAAGVTLKSFFLRVAKTYDG